MKRPRSLSANRPQEGFTLLEVMVSLAIVGIAMLALLSLYHQDLQSVIRGQELSRAAMLAQAVMTQTELSGFPQVAATSGDFQQMYPNQYPNFRWERIVAESAAFPDIRKVTIVIHFGPRFGKRFGLVEFVHNPQPPEEPLQQPNGRGTPSPQQPNGQPLL
jgi:general secretion pathway protein I